MKYIKFAVLAALVLFAYLYFFVFPPECRADIYHFMLLVGGAAGLYFAWIRIQVADKNYRQDRFRIGAELLSSSEQYSGKVAGVAILADLLKRHPSEFGYYAMKAFEAVLRYPPRYGGGANVGCVDYQSVDTVEIAKTINELGNEFGEYKDKINLLDGDPFIDDKGKIKPNPKHPDYVLVDKKIWR